MAVVTRVVTKKQAASLARVYVAAWCGTTMHNKKWRNSMSAENLWTKIVQLECPFCEAHFPMSVQEINMKITYECPDCEHQLNVADCATAPAP
jgi:transposase-like protein